MTNILSRETERVIIYIKYISMRMGIVVYMSKIDKAGYFGWMAGGGLVTSYGVGTQGGRMVAVPRTTC
jgi:hypothetical protein